MKDTHYKVALGAVLVLLVIAVSVIIKQQWDAEKRQQALQQEIVEMKQLQDGIVRGQSRYVSKEDFEKFADNMDLDLDVIQDDLDQYGGEIKVLGKIVASSKGRVQSGIISSGTTPRPPTPDAPQLPTCPDGTVCPNVDPFGYLSNSQHLSLTEPFENAEIPFGDVTFEAWKKKPWSIKILPRQYMLSTVLGEDEDGRHYVYNRFQIGADGEVYEVPIEQSEYVEKVPEASFRFDPHVNLGLSVGPTIATQGLSPDEPKVRAEVQPTLDVSFFSYGHTKVNPEWRFLGVGIGYETQNQSLGFVVNPVDYNVGEHLPVIDNLYLGPTIGVDIQGRVFVGGGIRVGL